MLATTVRPPLRRAGVVPAILVLLVAAAIAWPSPAAAQVEGRATARPQADAKPQQDAKPQPEVEAVKEPKEKVDSRVYDVRDLLASIRNYPFAGTMAGSAPPKPGPGSAGAPAGAGPEAVPETAADQLQRIILESIAPETWRDNGGSVGAARMVNGLLIVTQTETNHKLLANMLAQFRETNARMVRVRAHWLLLQPGDVDGLYKRPAGGAKADKADKPESAFPEIDRDALEKAGGKGGHHRAETVCYNGQTVHVASGRARRVIAGVTAAVGTGAAAYEPTVETVRSGLVLQVTPLLSPGRPAAMLDVYSAFADVDSGPPDAAKAGQADLAPAPFLDNSAASAAAVSALLQERMAAGLRLAVKVRQPLTDSAAVAVFNNFAVQYVFTEYEDADRAGRARALADQVASSGKSRGAFVGNFNVPPTAAPGRAPAGGGGGLPLAAEHAVDAGSVVDQYRALSQELRTTISVPLGRPVLVGGMTLDPAAKGDSPQLYLVVEVTASE